MARQAPLKVVFPLSYHLGMSWESEGVCYLCAVFLRKNEKINASGETPEIHRMTPSQGSLKLENPIDKTDGMLV